MNDTVKETPAQNTAAPAAWRKKLRMPLMIAGPALVVISAVYYYVTTGRYESTDDAYVNAARVSISTNVPGRVVELDVEDNERVQRGQILFRLDDRPYQVIVDEARAKLDNSRLQVEALKATYRKTLSELRSDEDTLAYENRETERQRRLLSSGISSQAQVDRAMHAQESAVQAVAAGRQQIETVLASLGGNPDVDPDKHPTVMQARAELERAMLNLSYTIITAPDQGIVTRVESLQVGDYVNAANPVFALLATHDLWVEANFKEVQLTNMKRGQTATVKIDTYPGRVFTAHVASLSPGTGSQFALLPAENATGNWVKIVQRLPVRIEVNNADPMHPLYAGLSATVKIDTHSLAAAAPDGKSPAALAANISDSP
jgi:membrane fusion protein (multidrug efflux system)